MAVKTRKEGHSHSPPGTKPMPVRRNTKHKTVTYGELLKQAHIHHQARKAQRLNAAKEGV